MEKGIYVNPTTFVPLNQIKEGLTAEIATRSFAIGGYTGFFNYLPDPDPILRKLGQDQTVYKDLLSDDQAGPLYSRRKNLTKSLDWFVEQNDAGDAEVELCETVLTTLEGNGCKVKDIISQTLNPVGFGYSVFEINFHYFNSGKLLPVAAWEKPREWFLFDNENQLRFRTKDNYEGIVIKGKDADPKIAVKFILLQNDPTYENPYGDKALSRCFWPVTFKRGGMKFFSVFIEKYGMPYLFGKLPRGAKEAEHEDLLSKLNNMVQDAVGTGPDDSSLQLIETAGTKSADLYDKYLQRCDNSISKAILGNALSTDIQKSGARAASETGATTIEGDIEETDRDFPVTFFNELFKRVIDLNLGTGKYPTFGVKEIDDAKTEFATTDKTISEAFNASGQKIKWTKSFLINRYNYDEEEFEIEEASSQEPGVGGPFPNQQIDPITGLPIAKSPDQPITDPELSALADRSLSEGWFKKLWNKLFNRNIELQDPPPLTLADQLADVLPEKLLQFQAEGVLQPIIELAKNSTNRDEFINSLADQFPKMETQEIQDLATKVLFIAGIEGRLSA